MAFSPLGSVTLGNGCATCMLPPGQAVLDHPSKLELSSELLEHCEFTYHRAELYGEIYFEI